MRNYFKLNEIDKINIPHQKGYQAKLIKDSINGIGFYILEKTQTTLDIENAKEELKNTSEKLIECFEYFLTKITNLKDINNLTDLFKIDDFPYNLKELLINRKDLKDKITSLENEVSDENN